MVNLGMAHHVKALPAKPDELSSVPSHRVERIDSCKLSSDLHTHSR